MKPITRRRRPLTLLLVCWAVGAWSAGCAPSQAPSPPAGSSNGGRDSCAELLDEARNLALSGTTDRTQLNWTVDELAYRCDREFSTFVEEFSGTASGQAQPRNVEVPAPGPDGFIPWSDAINHVGSERYVCGPLVNSGNSGDDVFLNLGRGYPDADRFTIVLWDVGMIESLPNTVTICATGTVSLYEGTAQIELRSTSAVEIWE